MLGNSWLARSTSRSCTELTLKQFSDNPMGRRTTDYCRKDPSFQRAETKGICSAPQRNRVTVAFFGQECAKTQEYAPSTAKPCDSCHFSSHVLDPNTKAIHVRAQFNSLRPEVQQLACLVLSVDTKHKHDTTCVCTLPVRAGVAPILVEA